MLNATGRGMRRVSSVHPANTTINAVAKVDVSVMQTLVIKNIHQ